MEKITARLSEPSTFAGLSAIMLGLDRIFNLHGVANAAAVVAKAGTVAASGGGLYMTVGTLLAGLMAVLMPEKK